MLREAWLILRARLIGVKNGLPPRRAGWKGGSALLGLVLMAGIGWLVFTGARHFLGTARSVLARADLPEQVWRILCLNLATGLTLTGFIFLFMTAVGTVTGAFFEGGNLEFLLARPLRPRSIFSAIFLESLGRMILGLVPFVLPCWLALGAVNQAGALYYLMVGLSFLGGAVFFLGPVAVLLLAVMRFVTRQRLRQIVVTLSLMLALVFVFGTQYLSTAATRLGAAGEEWLAGMKLWSVAGSAWMPHVWLARAPLASLGWPGLSLPGTALPIVLAAAAVFTAAAAVAESIFAAGWSAAQESPQAANSRPAARRRLELRSGRGGPIFGLLRKDLTLVRREPLLWYNLSVSVIIIGFFVWNMTRAGRDGGIPPAWLPVFYAGLVVLGTANWNGQIGGLAISREGGGWWLLQSLPGRAEQVFLAKLAFSLLPQALLVVLALFALALTGAEGFSLGLTTLLALSFTVVITALSLALDAAAPNFHLRLDAKWGGGKNAGAGKVVLTTMLGIMVVAVMVATHMLPAYYRAVPFLCRLDPGWAGLLGRGGFFFEILGSLGLSWAVGTRRLRRLLTEEG